jgi:ATPase subunit of ABC transporter with duplicated ATPase domains
LPKETANSFLAFLKSLLSAYSDARGGRTEVNALTLSTSGVQDFWTRECQRRRRISIGSSRDEEQQQEQEQEKGKRGRTRRSRRSMKSRSRSRRAGVQETRRPGDQDQETMTPRTQGPQDPRTIGNRVVAVVAGIACPVFA